MLVSRFAIVLIFSISGLRSSLKMDMLLLVLNCLVAFTLSGRSYCKHFVGYGQVMKAVSVVQCETRAEKGKRTKQTAI